MKRLAASVTVAARANGLDELQARTATLASVCSYRERITEYAAMPMLTTWYEHIDPAVLVKALPPTERVGTAKAIKKAKARHDLHVAAKLTHAVDGRPKIIDQPPLIDHGPFEDFDEGVVHTMLDEYKQTLLHDRRQLLDRYLYADFARKVVGVGSVGTYDYVVLFEGSGGTGDDPLILQLKQATTSCLEPYFGAAGLENHAERVVNGQRLAQAASDILLGWSHNPKTGRCFYWRQFRDHKASFDPAAMSPTQLGIYSAFCGWSTRPLTCTLRRRLPHQRLPRYQQRVRQSRHRLRRTLRRPNGNRPPSPAQGDQERRTDRKPTRRRTQPQPGEHADATREDHL